MAWSEFTLAFATFFVSHSVPVRPKIKAKLVNLLGSVGFTIAYSILSLAVLYWLILASGRAPFIEIWAWQTWQNQVPQIAMAFSLAVVALTLGRPNPFSFGGANNDRFDPISPGLVKWLRHPLLFATLIWSLAHIVPNGDLAHVILFGVFATFSWAGMKLIDRRKRRMMGAADWSEKLAKIKAANSGFFGMPALEIVWRLLIAVLLYALIVAVHATLFGVSPFG